MTDNFNKHPTYTDFEVKWELCRDCYLGEKRIKEAGVKYLPMTAGQIEDGAKQGTSTPGYISYDSYKQRGRFHDYFSEAVERMVGMLWNKNPTITIPNKLKPVLENFSNRHENIYGFLRNIHEQQLITGRVGVLLDVDEKTNLPYATMYIAEDIINWSVIDDFIVLNESKFILNKETYTWEFKNKYRVLTIKDGVYKTGVFDNVMGINEGGLTAPTILGKTLDKIPFVFINSQDTVDTPSRPPLLGLAETCIGIYRAECDYRQSLFLQGQDTLVISNGISDNGYRVGAGSIIELPMNGKAEFIGVSSTGLAEQRSALENDKAIAAYKAGQVIDTRSRQRESGDALQTRIAAQATSLTSIANASAYAFEKLLKIMAEWISAPTDSITLIGNTDFANESLSGRALVEIMTAKSMGAPISNESIHKIMIDRELTEFSYAEEIAKIESEQPLINFSENVPGNEVSNPSGI